ncbi:hypothetical protein [Nocardia sp. NPDC050710]|uniref:nucleotidyltransferase domain-containing protein n=1 Tax=Nocardia sp. NPDC050710 TaxID=3157220 RepID=UPI0033C7A572
MRSFPVRTPVDAEAVEFCDLWGPWAVLTPTDVAEVLMPLSASWWICGGWAIDAFTGTHREHSDIDVSIFRSDIPALRKAIGGQLHIWSAGEDGIRPVDDRFPEVPATADQVWLRENARSPWLIDMLLNPGQDGNWVNRRDPAMAIPLEEATWRDAHGIRYLNPEFALAFKAKHNRPKDLADLHRTLPRLNPDARATVRAYLRSHHPDHDWLATV